jgi:hypothetical protein
MPTKFWLENLKGREYFRHLGVGGRVTLKWTFDKEGVRM